MKLFTIASITVRVHYTWFLAFLLIAWSVPRTMFPFGYFGWTELTYWIVGSLAALLIFGSVLFHEFAHSFMALARGMKVESITLFIFGGAAVLKSEPRRPSDEFFIAVVGPASSLLLALIFLVLSITLPLDVPARVLLTQLAFINGGLALFNLLPGFPLDGGRVFRAIVWGVTGSMRRGTTIATIVGQVFAIGLIAFGLIFFIRGVYLTGVWLIFIGWFLNGAAAANRRQFSRDEALRNIPVSSLMRANPPIVRPDETMDRVVLTMLLRDGVRSVPVVQDGHVIGVITIGDARNVPQSAWPETTVGQAIASSSLISVGPDESILHAFDLFDEHSARQMLVMRGDELLGVLNHEDLVRFLELSRELGVEATLGRRET
ncbi:MAG: site-2 protease family protein [Chloroflexi bacterium]|nr:site-2 protease family protein [Chloroflexota bacterium]